MVKYIKENNELKQIPLKHIKEATLLRKEEVRDYLTRSERVCGYNGKNSWWWTKTPGYCCDTVAYVDSEGGIHDRGDYTYFEEAVRPALRVQNVDSLGLSTGDVFDFGGYKFKLLSPVLALCEMAIGQCAFREDEEAKDANDYGVSDVKKFLGDWFDKALKYEYDQQTYEDAGIDTDRKIFDVWAGW